MAARLIPVTEKLPEPGQQVIAYRPDADQYSESIFHITFYGMHGREGVTGFNCHIQPTHWAALPVLVKGKDK
jgi:hypothetical protein